jgi:hypothetical protein
MIPLARDPALLHPPGEAELTNVLKEYVERLYRSPEPGSPSPGPE